MAVKFTNNAATTLAAGINSSATSISVTDGSVFPAITGSDHFYVTFDDTTNTEIVKVTARSGNTLTVVRGQDDTTARAFSSGDKAELRVVAALLEDVKTEVTSTLSVDTFTGDDSTTAFTLSQAPSSEDNLIVFIEGVYQNPGDFTLSGTTLTLDSAPVAGRKIVAYHVSGAVSGNNLNHDQFTADGSTAAFTLSISPIHENNTQVFIDGVYQQKDSYAVSGTTLTLDANPANGAKVEVMTFTQTDVNTIPASFVAGLTEVAAVGSDHLLVYDATDGALKKALASDLIETVGATPTFSTAAITNTTTGDSLLITTTEDSSTAAPVITLKRNSSSPADGDYLGQLKFKGENDADQEVIYAKVTGKISDASDGTEDGLLEFALRKAGSNNIGARLTSTDLKLINGTGLEVAGDLTVDTNTLFVDASADSIGVGTASPNTQLHILKSSTNAHHDHIKLEMSGGWSGSQNQFKNIVWNDGSNNVGGIGMTYDGTTTNMHFHSMYNGGYKSESDEIFSILGSGKCGINASAPTQALEVVDSNNYKGIHIRGSVAPCITFAQSSTTTPAWRAGISGYDGTAFAIATGASVGDILHIKPDGRTSLGSSQSTAYSTYERVSIRDGSGSQNFGLGIRMGGTPLGLWNTGNSGYHATFAYGSGGALSGSISFSTTTVTYGSASDYRLKENVEYTWDATTRLKQLKPCRFNWIADSTNTLQDGFLAHEVANIVPEAVVGEKDATYTAEEALENPNTEEGDAKTQMLDNAKLVPLLVKTIQELEARIETLENA